MKQQIILSGLGGQGVLFATRILAETALETGLDVLTSETHGMAMRGGTVISHIKVGGYPSPLIRLGQADLGLFLHEAGLDVHRGYLKKDGVLVCNRPEPGEGLHVPATELARTEGNPQLANLILLGFALERRVLFCRFNQAEAVVRRLSPSRQVDQNLRGLDIGRRSAAGDGSGGRNPG